MYKFTIQYYYERYHTGDLNYSATREGIVFAKGRKEAIDKVKSIDDNYIGVKSLTFEEVRAGMEEKK